MNKAFLIALTGAACAIATPVVAKDPGAKGEPSVSAPVTSSTPSQKTRYCVVETITGSHISTKTCKTRDDWLVLGFDPLKK